MTPYTRTLTVPADFCPKIIYGTFSALIIFKISEPKILSEIALSAEFQQTFLQISGSDLHIYWTLENGLSICHRSIPQLSASRHLHI